MRLQADRSGSREKSLEAVDVLLVRADGYKGPWETCNVVGSSRGKHWEVLSRCRVVLFCNRFGKDRGLTYLSSFTQSPGMIGGD